VVLTRTHALRGSRSHVIELNRRQKPFSLLEILSRAGIRLRMDFAFLTMLPGEGDDPAAFPTWLRPPPATAILNDWPSTKETLIGRLKQEFAGPDWNLFVEVYGPLIYRFCRRRNVQDADARDVTQNVFVAVQKGISKFVYDRKRGKFRSWLGTVTAREISRFRRGTQRAGATGAEGDVAAESTASDEAGWVTDFNSHVYQAALDRIRPDFEDVTWQAFELVWVQHVKPREAALKLKKPAEWVHRAKYRILRRLEKELKFLTADIPSFAKD
jgi:RNA polymerase sigma factor (sigma-70 family)